MTRFQALRILIVDFILLVFCGFCILHGLCHRFFYLQPKEYFKQPSTPQQKADGVYVSPKVSIPSSREHQKILISYYVIFCEELQFEKLGHL